MSIDLSGWPDSEGFLLRVGKAGLQAFAGDREDFVNALVWPSLALEDARDQGRDAAIRVRRKLSKLAREWTSERIATFEYSCDNFYYELLFNKKARIFLVIAANPGGTDITTVCGGDTWPARSGERWRQLVTACVIGHIALEQPSLPSVISIDAPTIITPFDLALAFSKSSAHADERSSTFLDNLRNAIR